MNRFIVSCENGQELSDLLEIAKSLEDYDFEAIYFDASSYLGVDKITSELACFSEVYASFSFFGKRFKSLSPWSKLFIAFLNSLKLIFLYYKYGVKFVLVGTPLLVYRLARILTFGNLKVVSLIRGVLVHSEKDTSLSSKVFMKLGWIGRSSILRAVISDYYSSLVFCTGKVSRDFLVGRGVPPENIRISGSIYCDSLVDDVERNLIGPKVVVFVSSAFAAHGYADAQAAQTELIRILRNEAAGARGGFIIRKHPREDEEIYSCHEDLIGIVDSSGCNPLTGYPCDSLFISTTSTLIFEMAYAGRRSRIVANDFFMQRFFRWYQGVGVDPVLDYKNLIRSYFRGSEMNAQDLTGVISVEHQGAVADFCAREIMLFLGRPNEC